MTDITDEPIFYWHDGHGATFPVDIADYDEAADCPHCKPVYSAETVDRLRARVAELEAADGICFTAMLVEIDGHAYGLRPNAAHIVKEAMADARRYRRLFDCPEPFCYRGEVFETKVVADNAIDTDMRKTP